MASNGWRKKTEAFRKKKYSPFLPPIDIPTSGNTTVLEHDNTTTVGTFVSQKLSTDSGMAGLPLLGEVTSVKNLNKTGNVSQELQEEESNNVRFMDDIKHDHITSQRKTSKSKRGKSHANRKRSKLKRTPVTPCEVPETLPSINAGGKHFGFGKTVDGDFGFSRAVVKFPEPPKNRRLSVCFHFPIGVLTHRHVWSLVKQRLHGAGDDNGIGSITFEDRNVKHGTSGLENRWIINLKSRFARDELLRRGILVFSKQVRFLPYDDIIQEEYQDFLQYVSVQMKLFNKQ